MAWLRPSRSAEKITDITISGFDQVTGIEKLVAAGAYELEPTEFEPEVYEVTSLDCLIKWCDAIEKRVEEIAASEEQRYITCVEMMDTADEIATRLVGLPREAQMDALENLRIDNPTMYALVVDRMALMARQALTEQFAKDMGINELGALGPVGPVGHRGPVGPRGPFTLMEFFHAELRILDEADMVVPRELRYGFAFNRYIARQEAAGHANYQSWVDYQHQQYAEFHDAMEDVLPKFKEWAGRRVGVAVSYETPDQMSGVWVYKDLG